MRYKKHNFSLNLRAGEWVEVRDREEILSTLDDRGRLENLPFMPEMLPYCGRRFQVYKRADKTCDTISGRRLYPFMDTRLMTKSGTPWKD